MYNILTCDDEQIAIDSLQFIFKKNFEGEINLFSASSGPDALQIVNREKIDIIFMDINMPGMTGLETISCIMNLKPETVIIVISAFDKFQFAQEAMNLGAFKYITKPVNRNIVIQTARAAMNLVDEKRGKLSDNLEIQKKLDTVSPMVESDFIYSVVFNQKNEDLSPYLEYFGIQEMKYCFTCIEVPSLEKNSQPDTYFKIRKIVNEHASCIMGSFMVNRIVLFFSFPKTGTSSAEINETLGDIFTILSMNISRGIRAGVSRIFEELAELSDCYNEALSTLNQTPSDGGFLFFTDNNENKISPAAVSQEEISALSERLLNRLRIGDGAGVQYLAGSYTDSLFAVGTPLDKIRFSVLEIIINAKNYAKEAAPNFDDSAFDNSFSTLSSSTSPDEIQNYLKTMLGICASAIQSGKSRKENPVIKKAYAYINLHISENFSLEDVAESVGVSHFYLSKLFREETNETFINYLTDQRLDKAKQLLQETDLSVKEITSSCGYNDQNYFSKLFKNKFGVSPTDFRRSVDV